LKIYLCNSLKIDIQSESNFTKFFNEDPIDPKDFPPHVREMLSIDLSRVNALDGINWRGIVNKQASRFAKYMLGVTKTHTNTESVVDDLPMLCSLQKIYNR
jgi:hypothetical protein